MLSPLAFSLPSFASCVVGTALLSSAANACNQLLEAPYDAQMKRTQNRVLVVHRFVFILCKYYSLDFHPCMLCHSQGHAPQSE